MNKETDKSQDIIISFLSKDNEWSITPVAQVRSKKNQTESRKSTLEKHLVATLLGTEIFRHQYRRIQNHLLYEHILSGRQKHRNAIIFLSWLTSFCPDCKFPMMTANKAKWQEAKKCIEELIPLSGINSPIPLQELNADITTRARAIISLREKGYVIPIQRGHPAPTSSDIAKFSTEMSRCFSIAGASGLDFVLGLMRHHWNAVTRRYVFCRQTVSLGDGVPQIPFGYLLNLALSYLSVAGRSSIKARTKALTAAVDLATVFFAMCEIQPFDRVAHEFRHEFEFIEEIREAAQFQLIFSPEQMPLEDAFAILSILVKHSRTITSEAQYTTGLIYLSVMELILSKQDGRTSFFITKEDVVNSLSAQFDEHKLSKCLDQLSFDFREANKGYECSNPFDASKINYHSRPFIKSGNRLCFLDSNLFSAGFVNSWIRNCLKSFRHLGGLFECCFNDILQDSSVRFIPNFKYAIPKDESLDGECVSGESDFIIDTESTLYIIEAKTKAIPLHKNTIFAGNETLILDDLGKSIIDGLTQGLKTEYYLRKFKTLTDINTNKQITLSPNKRIMKAYLSLHDRGHLHDERTLSRILVALLHLFFTAPAGESLGDFLKSQENFIRYFKSDIISKVYHDERKLIRTFQSFSLSYMIFTLQRSANTSDFLSKLFSTSSVSFGNGDKILDLNALERIKRAHS